MNLTTTAPGKAAACSTDRSPIELLRDGPIPAIQLQLRRDFVLLASELTQSDERALRARVRDYDDGHRFTFGRAMSARVWRHMLAPDITGRHVLQRISATDQSGFPAPLSWHSYPGVHAALELAVALLLEDVGPEDELFVSIYCHRVLLRPGAAYRGFAHRDNKPGERCGTCVFYPRADWAKIVGLSLFCRSRADLELTAARYAGAALLMRYPHNLVHGVSPGRHRQSTTAPCGDRVPSVRDFIAPAEEDFVKDLMIVTISEAPNAED